MSKRTSGPVGIPGLQPEGGCQDSINRYSKSVPIARESDTHTERRIIGIDPGCSGGIAVLSPSGRLLALHDMPTMIIAKKTVVDGRELDAILAAAVETHQDAIVYLEYVHAMKGQGVSSMFSFGRALGAVESLVAARRWTLEYVAPKDWQTASRVPVVKDGKGKRSKKPSIDAARRLFPDHATQFVGPKGGGIDGRAEAALIARYGWLQGVNSTADLKGAPRSKSQAERLAALTGDLPL